MEKEVFEQLKDDLKAQGKDVYLISFEVMDDEGQDKEQEYLFYKPRPQDYERFINESSEKRIRAMNNLVLGCVVEEMKEDLEAKIALYPGISTTITNELIKLLGVKTGNLKKL